MERSRARKNRTTPGLRGLKQEDAEDDDERFQRMPKACSNGDKVVGQGQQQKGPEEQPRGGLAAAQRKREPQNGQNVRHAVVDVAYEYQKFALGGGMRNRAPEEVKAPQGEFQEPAGMRADPRRRKRALLFRIARFAQLFVAANFRLSVDRLAPRQAHGFWVVAFMQLRAKVAAEGDNGMEDAVVTDHPRRDNCDEHKSGSDGAQPHDSGRRAEQ